MLLLSAMQNTTANNTGISKTLLTNQTLATITMGAKSLHEHPSTIGVDNQLTDRALRALLKHHESSASSGENTKLQLLENDLDVQVQFSLARIPGNASPKPIRIEIPHPLVKVAASTSDANDDGNDNLQDVEACIIVKEESKPWVQDLIARFPTELGCIKKVLGLQSLRVKHKTFAQRRELLARFDVFFADDRILPMLTKALGGKFFEKKKQPIAVKLTRKEALPLAIQKSLSSTFMFLSAGTCVTVKAGNTSMTPSRLLANIQAICTIVPTKVPKKWSNIRSISIKTTNSVALPIYNKTPEELEQIRMLAWEDKNDVVEVKEVEDEDADDNDKGKSKGKNVASTPLAKALKKQQDMKANDNERAVEKSSKSSKKKRKESVEAEQEVDKITTAEESVTANSSSKKQKNESTYQKEEEKASIVKTPKSSRKSNTDKEKVTNELVAEKKVLKSSTKKRKDASESTDQDAVREKESVPKSAKKSKSTSSVAPSTNDDINFIASKAFVGAKKGYVFKKSKLGLGYYKDVLPVVDKVWLSSLGKAGGGAGGRGGGGGGRKSMGHSMQRKKGGSKSRKSY